MALQELGQVLGKCRARQDHVAACLLSLQLQLALDVRKVSHQVDVPGVLVRLELPDQAERIHALEIQIHNDQRGMMLGLLKDIVLALDEGDAQTCSFGRFVDLDGEE